MSSIISAVESELDGLEVMLHLESCLLMAAMTKLGHQNPGLFWPQVICLILGPVLLKGERRAQIITIRRMEEINANVIVNN